MNDVTINDHTEEFVEALKKAKQNGLWAMGAAAEGHAKNNLTEFPRVDTGRLRNSVTHVEDDDATYIGTNVEYAPYVELGTGIFAESGGRSEPWVYQDSKGNWHYTHGMKPAHFLKNAATAHSDEYKELFEEALKSAED